LAALNGKRAPSVFLMTNTFETGGSERQCVVLAQALRKRGFCVEIGCIARFGPFQQGLAGIKEYPCGGSLYAWRSWQSRIALARWLRSQKIGVAHAFDFYTNLMLIPAARLARVPVVLGSHRQLGDLLRPAQFRAQGVAFRLCDRVVCNSRAAGRTLLEQGLAERKIVVIPNALFQEAFVQPSLPRSPQTLRIGMVARMNSAVKNYPALIRAAARLVPKFPNLEFLLVGDGPLRPELEVLAASLGLEHHVRFLGERHDVQAILTSIDISALPSRSESLSNAIIESMAVGLPVVATRVGGNCELVRDGETGFLVPVDDDASLADALEHLITRPDLRFAFANRAKEVAQASFSTDNVIRQYEQLYFSLLQRAGRTAQSTKRYAIAG
jgi:L-malate glycosyltransferase